MSKHSTFAAILFCLGRFVRRAMLLLTVFVCLILTITWGVVAVRAMTNRSEPFVSSKRTGGVTVGIPYLCEWAKFNDYYRAPTSLAVAVIVRLSHELLIYIESDRPFVGEPDVFLLSLIYATDRKSDVSRINWSLGGFRFCMEEGPKADLLPEVDRQVELGWYTRDEAERIIQMKEVWIEASAPLWFMIVATGAWPMLIMLRGPIRRWRRRKRGLCVGCGYDLRGNVSGVCSECGKETTKTRKKKTLTLPSP